jgi:hypothetical protein
MRRATYWRVRCINIARSRPLEDPLGRFCRQTVECPSSAGRRGRPYYRALLSARLSIAIVAKFLRDLVSTHHANGVGEAWPAASSGDQASLMAASRQG